MINLTTDLSTLTSIPKASLDKLVEKSQWCICHSVEESILNRNNIVEINIGIGILYIKLEEENIKYKFIPSQSLEDCVRDTVLNKHNPLIAVTEQALITRIINTYKDIFQ